MKVLLDPVYTGRPATCSSSYVAWQLVDTILKKDPDTFFYMTVPTEYSEDATQIEFWEKQKNGSRVQRIPVRAAVVDRMGALLQFGPELVDLSLPTSASAWDADIVVTTRVPQIANFRTNTGRPSSFGKGTLRGIFALDDIPILSFRDTVSWSKFLDLHTIAQYLLADGVILSDLWTKRKMLQTARGILAPSKVMELDKNVHEATPVKLEPLQLNNKYKKGETFNVVFTGRTTGTRNFTEVANVFRKHFAYAIGKNHVKFIISTQSLSFGAIDPGEIDFISIEKNNREEFHKLLKERAHVVVNLSTVEDFSLSTYEPMLYGVPVVVADQPWSEFLGPDYPFRAKNTVEAYAFIKGMIEDYDTEYQKFEQWHGNTWLNLVGSSRNRATSEVLSSLVQAHMTKVFSRLDEGTMGGKFREIAATIMSEDIKELDLLDYLQKNDLIVWHKDWFHIPNTKKPSIHLLKLLLLQQGYKDTGKTGVLTRA